MHFFWVFIGGGLGAAARWLLSDYLSSGSSFPMGTFSVNMIGCFLIGIVSAILFEHSVKWELLLIVGFLGGFTTFSSFGLDMFKLIQTADYKNLLSYALLSNVLGLILVIIGHKATTYFIS
ncbi:MAG: fluoride efflux transporter CrcB [Bacteroidia bacterium]|nr:fluoride efflux transporter CrcB [Bacteroidia bacterium]NNJ56134.1 fluoride efflux transporter CrcB [Bacteroidia bacterium]